LSISGSLDARKRATFRKTDSVASDGIWKSGILGNVVGKAQRAEAGIGFFASPLPSARGSGERCKLSQWGPGRSPDRLTVLVYILDAQDSCSCNIYAFILNANSWPRPYRVYTAQRL